MQPGDVGYVFSLPNIYPYAGVSYATADSFFRIDCATQPRVSARDDVSEVVWIRFAAIELPGIGLDSARMAVERFLREEFD